MKVLALSAVAICLFAGSARADLEYDFTITLAGIQPFSFSFRSPTFLGDGDVPTFTPFTITDVNSYTFTQGLATENGTTGCFEFGTASNATLNPSCDVAVDSSPPGAALLLELASGLPTATGLYTIDFADLLANPGDFGSGTLEITSVPEPASIGLLGIVLAVVVWTLRKRPTGELCGGGSA